MLNDMATFWDEHVKQGGAISAICYHATPEEFEELGKQDAEYFLTLCQQLSAVAGPHFRVNDFAILDIGGGIGRVAKHLAPKVGRYYLLDISLEMLEEAGDYLGELVTSGKVRLVTGNGYTLTAIKDASIDFAMCDLCFQHMDREAMVSYLIDLGRVLRQDGCAWFYVPPMSYPERFEEAKRGDWPANLHRWEFGELAEVCVRLGYRILSADPDVIEVVIQKAEPLPRLRTESRT